jgi:hypothetical protein
MSIKSRALLAMAAIAVGVSLTLTPTAIAASAPDASAQSGWTAYHTRGDVAGANAAGSVYTYGNQNRVKVTGTIKDTKADGKLAILQLWATYADGGHRYERDITGGSKALGQDGGYTFASSVRTIEVQECLGHKTASGRLVFDKCAPGWHAIW